MSEILTDLYSIFSFRHLYDSVAINNNIDYSQCFHLIENLVLCDKIIVEANGVNHYNLDSICSEFSDAFRFIENKRLYDRTPLDNTFAVGNDFSKRAIDYADVAKENDIYYSPHPVRESLIIDRLDQYVEQTTKSLIEKFDQKIIESQSGSISNINLKIPPVVEHVLYFSKTQNITISDSINEIRNSRNAQAFRHHFSNLDSELKELSPRKQIPFRQKLLEEIEQMCSLWTDDMDAEVQYRRRRIKLTKVPIIGKLLETIGLTEITIDDPILFPDKPHLLFINDLYQK